MIFHCKNDGAVLVHFALNNKFYCPKCKLYRTRVEVAFVKGGLDERDREDDSSAAGKAQITAGSDLGNAQGQVQRTPTDAE